MEGEDLLILIVGIVATTVGLGFLFAALRNEWRDWSKFHPFRSKRNRPKE